MIRHFEVFEEIKKMMKKGFVTKKKLKEFESFRFMMKKRFEEKKKL
jgi:hypothetical protein